MTGLGILFALAAAALVAPRIGVAAAWRRLRSNRERERSEDALKHILAWQHRSKSASLESLAGALGLSLKAVAAPRDPPASGGLDREHGSGNRPSPVSGEQRALEVVRAHRLWETPSIR